MQLLHIADFAVNLNFYESQSGTEVENKGNLGEELTLSNPDFYFFCVYVIFYTSRPKELIAVEAQWDNLMLARHTHESEVLRLTPADFNRFIYVILLWVVLLKQLEFKVVRDATLDAFLSNL